MSNMMPKPFFARFLESQEPAASTTLKFPSDWDDDGGESRASQDSMGDVTMKFPSDSDDDIGI